MRACAARSGVADGDRARREMSVIKSTLVPLFFRDDGRAESALRANQRTRRRRRAGTVSAERSSTRLALPRSPPAPHPFAPSSSGMGEPFARALAVLAAPAGVDPSSRAEAERYVTAASDDPAIVRALLERVVSAPPPERHLAAVLLSTSAGKHWRALDESSRAAARDGVLAALASSDSLPELRALAHAADVIAQASAVAGTPWDALLPALSDAAVSPLPVHREAAMLLLGNLVESMGAHLHPHHAPLATLFLDAVAAPVAAPADARVRDAALGALAQLAAALAERGDFLLVAEILPAVVRVCLDAARAATNPTNRDESAASAALRALAAAVAVDADAVFGPELQLLLPVVDVALAIGADAAFDPNASARADAFAVLEALATAHAEALDEPRRCQTAHASDVVSAAALMLPPLCAAAREVDAADADASGEAEATGPAHAARAVLRRCATRLPPAATLSHVARPVLDAAATGAVPSAGALAALAVVVEGCASEMAEDAVLVPTLGALDAAIRSGDAGAARGAARVLAELAEHAGHALTQLHADVVLPHVTNALRTAVDAESKLGADGESGEVEGFSAPTHAALASLCENFSNEELAPGVDALARTLVAGAACAGAPPGARARCLTTLAAVARAAAWDFEPYARETLDALAALADEGANNKGAHASANANANKEIRARALAAMATVVAAVGEDSAPPGVIGALLDAATRDASTVGDGGTASTTRECALRCFGRLATTLETRVAPWIDVATGAALRALERDRASAVVGGGRHGRSAVTTGNAGEATAAAETLGAVVNACGSAARPRAREIVDALAAAAGDASRTAALRLAAARALEFAVNPLENDAEEGDAPPPRERLVAGANIAADAAKTLARVLAGDDAPEVALAAATSLETVIEKCGKVAAGTAGDVAATEALAGAFVAAKEACGAVEEGAAACQAELAETGREGGDGDDGGTVFFDLEDQAKRVLARCGGGE